MAAPRLGRFSTACRLWRSRDGSAAVEFGLLAVPFCMLIFSIIELGLVFVTDSVLENATIETGRLVRTGQAADQGMDATRFKAEVCRRMEVFAPDCTDRATVDVRVLPSFSTTPPDPMADGKTFNESGLTYTNGAPGNLVLVRVWYKQPLLTTYLAQGLSRLKNGKVILTATTTFRNEPK